MMNMMHSITGGLGKGGWAPMLGMGGMGSMPGMGGMGGMPGMCGMGGMGGMGVGPRGLVPI